MPKVRAEVLELNEPIEFEASTNLIGPDPTEPCVCGSGDPGNFCHRDNDGRWYAAPQALLNDARTGYAHPGCYASRSRDCSTKISNEHWLSRGILEKIADPTVTIEGLRWAGNKAVDLKPKALGSNILCDRHNRALSDLDATALRTFNAVRQFDSVAKFDRPAPSQVLVLCGERLELWLLKLAWGSMVANVIKHRGEHESRTIRALSDGRDWTEVLFRGARWPRAWGLYCLTYPGMEVTPMGHIQIEAKFGDDESLWSMAVEMGPVAFHLCLGTPDTPGWNPVHHPGGILIRGVEPRIQSMLAITWRNGGKDPMTLTRVSNGVATRSPSGSLR